MSLSPIAPASATARRPICAEGISSEMNSTGTPSRAAFNAMRRPSAVFPTLGRDARTVTVPASMPPIRSSKHWKPVEMPDRPPPRLAASSPSATASRMASPIVTAGFHLLWRVMMRSKASIALAITADGADGAAAAGPASDRIPSATAKSSRRSEASMTASA